MSTDDLIKISVEDFAAATASKAPAPGGGAVAAVVGSLGVALGEMALVFSSGRKKYAEVQDQLDASAAKLRKARELFLALACEDADAFTLYEQAMRRDDSDSEKASAVELAMAVCINIPREMSKLALLVLQELESLVANTTRWLISDLAAGAILAESVTRLADLNVRINASQMADRHVAGELLDSSAADCRRAAELMEGIYAAAKNAISENDG